MTGLLREPGLIMCGSKRHNGSVVRWKIYGPRTDGAPFVHVISSSLGYRIDGDRATLAEARSAVADYFDRTALPN